MDEKNEKVITGESYVIYYVNLSLLKKGAVEFIKIMHKIESNREPAENHAKKAQRAINGTGDSVLNEYRINPEACGGIFKGLDEPLYVYGLQTNECPLKAVLNVTDINELIIVASSSVFKESIAVYGNGTQKEGRICIAAELEARKNRDFLDINDIEQYNLYDQETDVSGEPSKWTNTLDYFIMEIRHYLMRVKKKINLISIYPIDDDTERTQMTDCSIIVAERALKKKDTLKLIIDTNGGKRDMSMIQLAIIRALKTSGIKAENILYSNYNSESVKWRTKEEIPSEEGIPSTQQVDKNDEKKNKDGPVEIQDRSQEYDIFDVVSGIDEFVSYGRVEKLHDYFKKSKSGIKDVLESIDKMCKAFMTCFTNDMIDSVLDVRKVIDDFNSNSVESASEQPDVEFKNQSVQYKLAKYVVEQIENDLHDVLTAVGGGSGGASSKAEAILPLIEWCRKKKYYQQAVTLYVDRIDTWYYEKGILQDPHADFYNFYLGTDCKKEEFDAEIRRIYNTLVSGSPYPFSDKNTYLNILNQVITDSNLNCNSNHMNSIISQIRSCYDNEGNKKDGLTGQNANVQKNIKEYAKKLKEKIQRSPSYYINGNQPSQNQVNALSDRVYLRFPKDQFIRDLRNLNCSDYGIDNNLYRSMINAIDIMYDNNGIKIPNSANQNFNFQRSDLYDLLIDNTFTSCYKKTCIEYVNYESMQNPLANGSEDSRNKTYLWKKICIDHYTDNFANNRVLLRVNGSNNQDQEVKLSILKKIAQFYLAFKIVRNNTNHSNGTGDIYTREVCDWLGSVDGGNVIDSSTCIWDPYAVTLKYETTDELLKEAIKFNKSLEQGYLTTGSLNAHH